MASGGLYSLNNDIVQSILIAFWQKNEMAWNKIMRSHILYRVLLAGMTEHNSHADSEMLNTLIFP